MQNLLVEGNQPHLTPELFVYLTFLWRFDVHCHGDDTQIKRCCVQLFPRHYGILSCPPIPESYSNRNYFVNFCNKIRYCDEECLLRFSSEGAFRAVSLWKHKRWCQKLPLAWMSLSCSERSKQEELQISEDVAKSRTIMQRIESTRVGTSIVATIYLQLIQNRYMFRSFTVLQCSHQHCVQPIASDVEVVGYL